MDFVRWARLKMVRHWLYDADVIDREQLATRLREKSPCLVGVSGSPQESFGAVEVFVPVRRTRFVSHSPRCWRGPR